MALTPVRIWKNKIPACSANRALYLRVPQGYLPTEQAPPTIQWEGIAVSLKKVKNKVGSIRCGEPWGSTYHGRVLKALDVNGLQGLYLDIDSGTQLKTNTAFGM